MTSDGDRPHVVVVGGGIAGLAAAHRLTLVAPRVAVTLIEAEERLGGKILTERCDGFVIEGGPDSFLSAKPRGVGLCRELGLEDRLRGTTPRRRRAFVRRGDRLHDLPEGLTGLVPTRLGPILRSGLLSPVARARFGLDYVLPPRRGDDDESLAAFVRRRLGGEVYDRLVEPLMAGIYAGDGDRLSLAATFPQLRRGELDHGGLIKGVLAAKRRASAAPNAPPRPAFVAPAGGLDELVVAIAERLCGAGVRIVTGTPATRVIAPAPTGRAGPDTRPTPSDDGRASPEGGSAAGEWFGARSRYAVALGDGDLLPADAVVLATPAFATADLLADLDGALARELRAIPHASSAIVTLAYPRADVLHPLDGYGYVVPRIEGGPVLACTWTSAKWSDRAPAGFVLLRVFVGRFGRDDALAGADDALLALARTELRATLDVVAPPVLARVHRWPRGMPQYTLGHLDRLAAIERRLAAHPGLALAGNAYRGVGLPDCIASGESAADAVVRGQRSEVSSGARADLDADRRGQRRRHAGLPLLTSDL